MQRDSLRAVPEYLLMDEHSSYHNQISKKEAKKRLKSCGKNVCYLTRFSSSGRCYRLTVYNKEIRNEIREFEIIIQRDDRQHNLRGKDMKFATIKELLEYYENNRIDPSLPNIGEHFEYAEYSARSGCNAPSISCQLL